MNLLQVKNGKWVRVIRIGGGRGIGHHGRAGRFGWHGQRGIKRRDDMGLKSSGVNYRLKHDLVQLGFLPGNSLRIIRRAPFHGPLLIEVEGREIVIGRGVARHVIVEYV